MFQLYPFRGDDYQQVYGQMNEFLRRLDVVNGIEIEREEIREDTKNYLDYDRAVTTVTVCVRFVDEQKSAQAAQIAKVDVLYTDCTKVRESATTDDDEADLAALFLEDDGGVSERDHEWANDHVEP